MIQLLIPVLSYFITAAVKRLRFKVPNKSLPYVAAVAGIACQAVTDAFGLTQGSDLAGAVAGVEDGGATAGLLSGAVATYAHQLQRQYQKRK